MVVNEGPHGPHGKETEPLLGDVPAEIVSEDETLVDSPKARSLTAGRILVKISFLLLGDFLASADESFYIAIYEKIASEFESSDHAAWLMLVANLGFCTCLPIYGYLGDRYDSKKIILVAYAIFMCGCALGSVAPSFWFIILSRLVTATGGAGLYAMTAIVIADDASPADVGVLRSYVIVAAFLGRNVGPIAGGLLADFFGWRRAFLCEIPLALCCAIVITFLFDSKKQNEHEPQSTEEWEEVKKTKSIDLIGVLLFTAMITTLVFALTGTGYVGKVPAWIVCSILMVASGIALFWRERAVGDDAFIPPCIFNRDLCTQYLIQFFWLTPIFAMIVLLPVYFARVENAKSSTIALHMLPMAATNTIGNIISSRIIKITKRYKFITRIGVCFGMIGLFSVGLLWQGSVGLGKSLLVAFLGLGGGFVNASTFIAVSANSDEGRRGALVGFFFLAQELGCLVGTAASSTMMNLIFKHRLLVSAPQVVNRSEIITQIMRDSSYAFSLSNAWLKVAIDSFLNSWQVYCFVGGIIVTMIHILVFTIREKKLE